MTSIIGDHLERRTATIARPSLVGWLRLRRLTTTKYARTWKRIRWADRDDARWAEYEGADHRADLEMEVGREAPERLPELWGSGFFFWKNTFTESPEWGLYFQSLDSLKQEAK